MHDGGTPEDQTRDDPDRAREPSPDAPAAAGPAPELAMLLTGDLPCIGCGYDIRGLSVLAPCPECGLAVRATILHRVDPHAEALRPMPTPWLTAVGTLAWTACGLAAALCLWAPRLSDVVSEISSGRVSVGAGWASTLAVAFIVLSGLGLLGMIRPVVGLPARRLAGAALAALCTMPLAYAVARAAELSAGRMPYLGGSPSPERIGWRLAAAASLAGMLLLIRPNARELVARSLVLRTKRVDRQTIYATLGALAVTAAGDGLRLLAAYRVGPAMTLLDIGSLVVLVGSVFLTLAVAGATVDGWRIAHSILVPSPSPAQALRRGRGPGAA